MMKMTIKAYFLINVAERPGAGFDQDLLGDLSAMPEVKSIERVNGFDNLMVKVETATHLALIADEILARPWVKSLRTIKVESVELGQAAGITGPGFAKEPGIPPD